MAHRDGTEVPDEMKDLLTWGTKSTAKNDSCVHWSSLNLYNTECKNDDDTFWNLEPEGVPDVSKLQRGYLCEARITHTIEGGDEKAGQLCHFPFKYIDPETEKESTHTSCAHIKIDGFNDYKEPWCATKVKEDGITVDTKAFCQDERHLIIDEEGAGNFCPFPFEFNGVRYTTCTRRKKDGSLYGLEPYYWCPSPQNVTQPGNKFELDGKIGKCYNFARPRGKVITPGKCRASLPS